jgi:hypothetical protein
MAKARSGSSNAGFHRPPVQDQQPLTLIRRLTIEIDDAIAQSREVGLSTRDAIELLMLLQARQFLN